MSSISYCSIVGSGSGLNGLLARCRRTRGWGVITSSIAPRWAFGEPLPASDAGKPLHRGGGTTFQAVREGNEGGWSPIGAELTVAPVPGSDPSKPRLNRTESHHAVDDPHHPAHRRPRPLHPRARARPVNPCGAAAVLPC